MQLSEAVDRAKRYYDANNGKYFCDQDGLSEKTAEALRTLIEAASNLEDAAILIRQLSHKLNRMHPDWNDPIASKAIDWLQRKGLRGSPLRKEPTDV